MAFGICGVERGQSIAIIVFLHVADNDELVILQIEFTVEKRDHQGIISDIFCIGNSSDSRCDAIAVIAGNASELQLVIYLCLDGRCAQNEDQGADRAQKIVAFYFHVFKSASPQRETPPTWERPEGSGIPLLRGFQVKT